MSASVLVFVAACLSSGAALKCYNCVSDGPEGYCSDSQIHSGRTDPVECPLEELRKELGSISDSLFQGFGKEFGQAVPELKFDVACVKKYYSQPNGVGRTERKCEVTGPDLCRDAGTETANGRLDFCGTCIRDGCNSAGRLVGNLLFWLLPLATLLLRHSQL